MIKTNTKVLLALSLSCCCTLSYAQDCDSLQPFAWLLGDWHADEGNNTMHESWIEVSPLTFEGQGQTQSKTSSQSVTREFLRLVDMQGQIYYVAKVAHNPLPVAFKLSQCSTSSAVFENSGHDFPQKIVYQIDPENRLMVTVSDNNDKGFSIMFDRLDSPD